MRRPDADSGAPLPLRLKGRRMLKSCLFSIASFLIQAHTMQDTYDYATSNGTGPTPASEESTPPVLQESQRGLMSPPTPAPSPTPGRQYWGREGGEFGKRRREITNETSGALGCLMQREDQVWMTGEWAAKRSSASETPPIEATIPSESVV